MWQEPGDTRQPMASMTDVVFRIQCAHLPVDHASDLSIAITTLAPQLIEQPLSGVHPIHVAGSQNGWERPDHEDQALVLSKRTRLKIRTKTGSESTLIEQLSGMELEIAGYPLKILTGQARPLEPATTLFSRNSFYQSLDCDSDEARFVDRVIEQCRSLGFSPTKILCGREQYVKTPTGPQHTRSVLLADVPALHSIALQDNGLGDGRTIGCGMLIPHKDTGAVNQMPENN